MTQIIWILQRVRYNKDTGSRPSSAPTDTQISLCLRQGMIRLSEHLDSSEKVCFNRSKQNHYHLKSTFQATSFLVAPTGLSRSKQSLFIYMFYTELFFEAVEEFYVSTYAYS